MPCTWVGIVHSRKKITLHGYGSYHILRYNLW
jgi:hypothetical protein